jgi:uncharacterized protein
MNIEHQTKEDKGRFVLEDEGEIRGQLVYTQRHNEMIIQHTEVDEDLRGQNLGNQLVEEAVEYARSNGLKVQPVCVFAKAMFESRKDFKDVLAA